MPKELLSSYLNEDIKYCVLCDNYEKWKAICQLSYKDIHFIANGWDNYGKQLGNCVLFLYNELEDSAYGNKRFAEQNKYVILDANIFLEEIATINTNYSIY